MRTDKALYAAPRCADSFLRRTRARKGVDARDNAVTILDSSER